jgi:hypothetical protein
MNFNIGMQLTEFVRGFVFHKHILFSTCISYPENYEKDEKILAGPVKELKLKTLNKYLIVPINFVKN